MGNIRTSDINVGVVGLGLMGTSFIATLLMAGHNVKAIAPLSDDMRNAHQRIYNHLISCEKSGLLLRSIESYLVQLEISEDYEVLRKCDLVVECVIEVEAIKESVYVKIESVVSKDTIIASNTSAMPISKLQKYLDMPQRFLGIHWAEPSYFTRFMEITCGDITSIHHVHWVHELAHYWGKEPTLLRRDIRGFITNRLMYAVYREALSIVTSGDATIEDVDKAFRYDVGSWITLMGIFRRMDFMGLRDYVEVFKTIFPQLCNDDKVPPLMQKMVDLHAKGTKNLLGLYSYTDEEAKKWNEAFALFNVDIFQLAALYPTPTEASGSENNNGNLIEFKEIKTGIRKGLEK